jgi:hypothetical protein
MVQRGIKGKKGKRIPLAVVKVGYFFSPASQRELKMFSCVYTSMDVPVLCFFGIGPSLGMILFIIFLRSQPSQGPEKGTAHSKT